MNRTTTKLSKEDVIDIALGRFRDQFREIDLSDEFLRAVFNKAIMEKHGEPGMTIPVWNGRELCAPEIHAVTVPEHGAVAVNSWRLPEYRSIEEVQPTLGVAGEFIDILFFREPEKEMFLIWLAWCLQNEGDKPNWPPFFYSASKGTGKSTICQLVANLDIWSDRCDQSSADAL